MSDVAKWPFPKDTERARLVRVAQAYRAGLADADPAAAKVLDERMAALGQGWVVGVPETAEGREWFTVREIAKQFAVTPQTVRNWAEQHGLEPRHDHDGVTVYRFADVLEAQRPAGGRKKRARPPGVS